MTPVLIAVIAIAAIVLSVTSARRALAERNVVERQQQALDLLGRMADRSVSTRPVVAPPGKYQPRHGKAPTPSDRIRSGAIAGAAAASAIVLVVLLVLSGRHHHTPSPRALPAPTTLPPSTTTLAPTTTTTAPPPLVLISDDTRQASYRMQGPSVQVAVVSSAPCWVEITGAAAGGPVTFAGTLRSGSVKNVTTGSPAAGASLRVANPALVSLQVNGTSMPLPQLSGGQPYTVHFEPATTAPA